MKPQHKLCVLSALTLTLRFLIREAGDLRRGIFIAASLVALCMATVEAPSQGFRNDPRGTQRRFPGGTVGGIGDPILEQDPRNQPFCPPKTRVVEIREADLRVNKSHHDDMLELLVNSVGDDNTLILLGPNVVLDFSDAPAEFLPLDFGRCVTLTSVAAFRPLKSTSVVGPGIGSNPLLTNVAGGKNIFESQPARTPSSLGPLLKFGPHRSVDENVFLQVRCIANSPPNDGVRISGFRIEGPSWGHQSASDFGIKVHRCLNVEISNMEIFGWGGAAIEVLDEGAFGDGQEPWTNNEGDRIGRTHQVRIFRNYIHHNQHPSKGGDANGYGVSVNLGAWAQIFENLFDFNRHAIKGSGDSGGYEARRNLVLKGGGLHGDYYVYEMYTHQFDVHGTGEEGQGGSASEQDWFSHNAFQYRRDNAIKIRGRPHRRIDIFENVFPHPGLEDDDWFDDAIHVRDRDDLDVIKVSSSNAINFDSFGKYEVCDFDGDAIDDLFLPTGVTWWFSSYGEFPWTFLNLKPERLDRLRFGYFDSDGRCDVLTEKDGQWLISSGGTGEWQLLSEEAAPLSEVAFGRFDPSDVDERPGATRQTTHAFRRDHNGNWWLSPLKRRLEWKRGARSHLPMSSLRFGDFTGDGVTDVLASVDRRWAISKSAMEPWRRLNSGLDSSVSDLKIANMDPDDNIDDILRLDVIATRIDTGGSVPLHLLTMNWFRSKNGSGPWVLWHRRDAGSFVSVQLGHGFAGRFGAAPGGGTVMIDTNRLGIFYSEAERVRGVAPEWTSLFTY